MHHLDGKELVEKVPNAEDPKHASVLLRADGTPLYVASETQGYALDGDCWQTFELPPKMMNEARLYPQKEGVTFIKPMNAYAQRLCMTPAK